MKFTCKLLFLLVFIFLAIPVYADKMYECKRVLIYKDGKPSYVKPFYKHEGTLPPVDKESVINLENYNRSERFSGDKQGEKRSRTPPETMYNNMFYMPKEYNLNKNNTKSEKDKKNHNP